jgi:hypothetical protein
MPHSFALISIPKAQFAGVQQKVDFSRPVTQTVYRIRNGQGHYSKGGKIYSDSQWETNPIKGKVWKSGEITNHLHQQRSIPGDWVVEEIEQVTTSTLKQSHTAQDFFVSHRKK